MASIGYEQMLSSQTKADQADDPSWENRFNFSLSWSKKKGPKEAIQKSGAKPPVVHWDIATQCVHLELVQDGPSLPLIEENDGK